MEFEYNALGQPIGLPVPAWLPPSRPAPCTLEGRYCRVEPLDPHRHASDLDRANRLDGSGAMWTYLPYGPFESFESYQSWVSERSAELDPLYFAITDRPDGHAVGVASYLRIDPRNGSIEVGHLAYSPLLQRTPAATEAMYLMMKQAFDLGYRRYEWKCNAFNAPSRAAAQRLGFSYEGTFRQAAIVDGRNRDTAWYALIDSEWPALRAAFETWLHPANFDSHGRQIVRLSDLTDPLLYQRG